MRVSSLLNHVARESVKECPHPPTIAIQLRCQGSFSWKVQLVRGKREVQDTADEDLVADECTEGLNISPSKRQS